MLKKHITYEDLDNPPEINSGYNWGYNCLTAGIHHGRPETIWNLPLFQASMIFGVEDLKQLVVARIYNDAMQYVSSSPFTQKGTGASTSFTQKWAEQLKTLAEEKFDDLLDRKMTELTDYYESSSWRNEVETVIERVKQNRLNPHYQPLHSHDSINLLCRILGTSCSRMVK